MATENPSKQQSADRAQGTTSQYGAGGTGQRWNESQGAQGQGTQGGSSQGTQGMSGQGTQGGQTRPAYGSAAQGQQSQRGRQAGQSQRYGMQRRGGYDASEYGSGYGNYGNYGTGYGSGPFSLMRRISDEMDRLFESFGMGRNFLPEESGQGRTQGASMWYPHLEVCERNGKLLIQADLPGVRREDVNVQVEPDAVIIQGHRQQQSEDNRQGYYHSERSYGSFYRTVPLPEGIDTEQAQATFRNGVLEIEVPIPQQQQRSRQLEIRDEGGSTYSGSASREGTSSASASSTGAGRPSGASSGTSSQTSAGASSGTSSGTSIGGEHGSSGSR